MAEPEEEDPDLTISANPARRFFVAMLVKDIELMPAIVDLVDNSIDGAKRLRQPVADANRDVESEGDVGSAADADAADAGPEEVAGNGASPEQVVDDPNRDRFKGLFVKIAVDGEHFEIEDNCGGISLKAAREYAFRFGRPHKVEGPLGEVGQFGVGMKRALFKLGTWFEVTSMSHHDSFTLPVKVTEWMEDESLEWSFDLYDVEEGLDLDESQTGTTIIVKPLHATIAEETGDPNFAERLRDELELRHAEAVRQGLELKVNDVAVPSFQPMLLVGEDFKPIYVEKEIVDDGGSLRMRLYAGLVRLREEERDVDLGEAEDFRAPPKAGWYLYCNDRLLLAADTSRLTGWGEVVAGYHPQYRQFRGYVMLDGDASLMPWTTTKTAVDEDSKVFRAVQTEMFDALQKARTIMNRLKHEAGASDAVDRPALGAMEAARPAALSAVSESKTFVVPPPPKRPPARDKSIQYRVDVDDFLVVSKELGTDVASEVGRRTFQFFVDNQVPE